MPEAYGGAALATNDDTAGQPAGIDIQALGKQLLKWANSPNLLLDGDLDAEKVRVLGLRCCHGYDIDRNSRKEWERKARGFMDLALQNAKEKTSPWPRCSNVIWPLLSQATNEFAAAIYPVIMDGDRVVKGKIVGSDKGREIPIPPEIQQGLEAVAASGQEVPPPPKQYFPGQEPGAKRRRADHVSEHMSYQLLTEQKEWQTDTDRMFRSLPIIGCAARKSWFDPVWGRNCSMYVSMLDLVVNYHAKTLETAPRVTEVYDLYPHEIEDRIRSEEFIPFTPGMASVTEEKADQGSAYFGDPLAPHLFLEQHCFWDLDGDGYEEPYTVTIHKQSQKVVRIVARFEADGVRLTRKKDRIAKIEPIHYYTLYSFMPNPESAIYAHGFGHVLGPINESINTAVNQMFDAGTVANMGGGFVGTGLAMHTGAIRFKMGEFKPVNSVGGAIRDAIWQPDFKGPSEVMFRMFGLLVEAGRELAGIKQITTGQTAPASTDPTTMMAMLEQGMRVFKDVYKRVLRALNDEYAKLFALNRRYMPEQGLKYQRADEQFEVTHEDYKSTSGVETVGDPNLVTDMQKLMRAQVLANFKDDPRCNGVEIIRRIFAASNIEDIDQIVLEKQGPSPLEQLQLQMMQAQLAGAITTNQKNHAQSILYLMQARKAAAEAQNLGLEAMIDAQLDREWMEIERTNNELAALQLVVSAHKAKTDEKKADAAVAKAKKAA